MAKRQHAVKSNVTRRAPAQSRTLAGDALSGVVIRVLRLAGLITAEGDRLAAPSGQTSARWQVLAAAEHAPSTVAGIARALGLARQSVQRVADLLTAEGLTEYAGNPEHQRAKLLRLTSRGQSVLAAIQKAQRTWADELGGAIGEASLRDTAAGLDELLTALLARIDGAEGTARN
jgi:DNA-binding MarR family transcriptional regulator